MPDPLPPHLSEVRERAQTAARLVLRGIVLNIGLVGVKLAGGILGQTYALIADAIESLLDVLSSIIVWLGFRVAAEPPDAEHPYGHGKAEPLAALLVAVFVFAAAGWIAWHAVEEIVEPHAGPRWWTLPLLAGVVAVKVAYSRKLHSASTETGSAALGVEAWHHNSDAVTSGAAFVGIALAIWGGAGWEAADDWAALLAAGVIAFNGVRVFLQALGGVMDSAVSPEFEQEVRAVALRVPGVAALDKCRVRRSGLSHLVDIHVRVDGNLSVRAGHAIAHAVKDALLASTKHTITDVSVHVEPER